MAEFDDVFCFTKDYMESSLESSLASFSRICGILIPPYDNKEQVIVSHRHRSPRRPRHV